MSKTLDSARLPTLRDKQRAAEEARIKSEREEARKVAANKAARVELTTKKKKNESKKNK